MTTQLSINGPAAPAPLPSPVRQQERYYQTLFLVLAAFTLIFVAYESLARGFVERTLLLPERVVPIAYYASCAAILRMLATLNRLRPLPAPTVFPYFVLAGTMLTAGLVNAMLFFASLVSLQIGENVITLREASTFFVNFLAFIMGFTSSYRLMVMVLGVINGLLVEIQERMRRVQNTHHPSRSRRNGGRRRPRRSHPRSQSQRPDR